MSETAVCRSYAKLNLHLAIQGRRADGFHDISSLFQRIRLYDTLRFRVTAGNAFDCRISGMDADGNIMYAAAEQFMRTAGLQCVLDIAIEKRIPIGAGLGGGSSNAAAVLRFLQDYFNSPLPETELAELGAKTGSDVPFFLADTPIAHASGRGEVLYPVGCSRKWWFLVVFPGFHTSTAAAFREWDRQNSTSRMEISDLSRSQLIEQYCGLAPEEWNFSNSFVPLMVRTHPLYARIFRLFESCGSGYSNLTGSGSACFGIFRDRAAAEAACAVLRAELPADARCLTADIC